MVSVISTPIGSSDPGSLAFSPTCQHSSGIIEQRHKPEIHVQLLVAVEERRSRIVRDEIKFQFRKSAQHNDVLDHPAVGLPAMRVNSKL